MAQFRNEKIRYEGSGSREAFYVSVSVVLNRANRSTANGLIRVAVRVSYNKKHFFINVADVRVSDSDFKSMCREYSLWHGMQGRFRKEISLINETFDRVSSVISQSVSDGTFDLETFRETWHKFSHVEEANLYDLWRDVASDRSVGTEQSYMNAYKRFVMDMGDRVQFSDFSNAFLLRWKRRMMADGLSKTTCNIYLRALRVVLNTAVQSRLANIDTKAIFSKISVGGRNSYNDRKEHYLNVEQWSQLWKLYKTKGEANDVCQAWKEKEREKRLQALGMMLFMYLADGMNLCDVLKLRFDSFYFQHDKKMMRFQRQKVKDRSGAKVIFPILEPLKLIIERQGEPEEKDGLVFGYLNVLNKKKFKDARFKQREEKRLTAIYNSVIRARMEHISCAVGLPLTPTPTWARHSFASNLIQAGVPKEYVAASMAHTDSGTTDNYIDRYSYAQMCDYNSRLLEGHEEKTRRLKEVLSGMTKEEILKFIELWQ